VNEVVHLAKSRWRCVAEPAGARDVGRVTLVLSSGVDEHDHLRGELRSDRPAMRQRGLRAELHEAAAFDAALRVLFGNDLGHVPVVQANLESIKS
jgi:hypothetical protein